MLNWLVDKIIARAKRTPFVHLFHADGSAYMERYWLRDYGKGKKERWFAIRLQHGELSGQLFADGITHGYR